MQISKAILIDKSIVLRWTDGAETVYPCLWLRDNDPGAFHPDTRERIFDLLSVDSTITPQGISVDGEGQSLMLQWPDIEQQSVYPALWLKEHRPGLMLKDASLVEPVLWTAWSETDIPRHSASEILTDPASMQGFLLNTLRYGITIVQGLEQSDAAGLDIGARIGPMRNSNFGSVFDVISKPDPNNLAYTSGHLPLHTDLPNQETPPAFQFLHCIANDAEGGESLYCDGFHIAAELRQHKPKTFELLSKIPIPFRFQDDDTDIRCHRPVIALGENGSVSMVAWNAHLAGEFDMDERIVDEDYEAYRTFMAMLRDPSQVVSVKLKAGEMVVFDNRRVLHGRSQFFPNTGNRHLKGYYVDRVDMESRIRLLSNQ